MDNRLNIYIREIAEFLDACWRSTYSQIIAAEYLGNMTVDERASELRRRLDAGESEFMEARDGGVLVGVCVYGKSFTEGYPDDGEIQAIYLRFDYIGQGRGRALLCEAEKRLSDKGFSHVVLDAFSNNERAVKFYLAHGYEKVKDDTVRLGDVDYPMLVFRKAVTRLTI